MSQSIGAFEAKTQFSKLLERVQAGEEIIITKHGHPVARLAPIAEGSSLEARRRAIEEIKALSNGLRLDGLSVRDLKNEGRR